MIFNANDKSSGRLRQTIVALYSSKVAFVPGMGQIANYDTVFDKYKQGNPFII
jgi:hypothetical protein